MLKTLKSLPILATVMSAGLMSGQAARADHVDVDIDRLKAEIRQDTHGWRVFVDYQIEIEDARRYDRFELLLTFSERGRPLVDRLGRPIEVAIPLQELAPTSQFQAGTAWGIGVRRLIPGLALQAWKPLARVTYLNEIHGVMLIE